MNQGRFVWAGILAVGFAASMAPMAQGQSRTVSTDTTASDVQVYSNLTINSNARLTLDAANWTVTNNLWVGTNTSLGHIVLTNGATLTYSGANNNFKVHSSGATVTSTLTVANGTLIAVNEINIGGSGAGYLYVGNGGAFVTNRFTLDSGKALCTDGAQMTLLNKFVNLGINMTGVRADWVIQGTNTRVVTGTTGGG